MLSKMKSKQFLIGIFSVVIVVAVLFTIVPAANAGSEGPLTPIPGMGRVPNATLVRMHKSEGTWYNEQAAMLRKATSMSTDFQKLIDAQSALGRDVSGLDAALATFNNELVAVREIHALAGSTIFSLTGWKEDGSVRDRIAAGQSLLEGRDVLKDSNHRLNQALEDLRKGFVHWKAARIKDPTLKKWPPHTPTPTTKP